MGTPLFLGGSHQGAGSALRRHHDGDSARPGQTGVGHRTWGGDGVLVTSGCPIEGGGGAGRGASPWAGSPPVAAGVGGGGGSVVSPPGAGDGRQGAGFGDGVGRRASRPGRGFGGHSVFPAERGGQRQTPCPPTMSPNPRAVQGPRWGGKRERRGNRGGICSC